jgi:hypothetical protein
VVGLVVSVLLMAVASTAGELDAVRLSAEPVIDGVPDEDVWSMAAVARDFVQVRPRFGEPSSFPTTAKIGFTSRAIYVAFFLSDPDPTRIGASVTARDGDLAADDSVGLLIDTLDDSRTGYYFKTNLLATQADGRIADNGNTVDERWDGSWRCAAARVGDGWTVEIEVPFEILRYQAGTWGINLMRTVPRRFETSVWAGPGESEWRVAQFGSLRGLEPSRQQARRLVVMPYGLAVWEEDGGLDLEFGGDLRLRLTDRLGADLTVNPDFALVEADVEEINLTRFELFIPEKRPFFLEGAEMYEQRLRQFYSRRIGDIDAGAKLIGALGSTDVSVLATVGDIDEQDAALSGRAAYVVGRVQQGFGASNVGLVAANRRLEGSDAGSVGLDATVFFSERIGLTAQMLTVHGPEADGGLAWFVRPAWDTSTSHFHIRYTSLDEGILDDFNATGFLEDDDRKELDTEVEHDFWLRSGALERISVGVNYNRYWSQRDVLRSWELEADAEVVLRNGWFIELEGLDEYKLYEKEFRNHRIVIDVGWDSRDGRRVEVFAGRGTNFDSDLLLYGLEVDWKLSDRWRVSYDLTRLELEPDPDGDTTLIHVLRTDYYFNPNLWLSGFFQDNAAIEKDNVQILLVWRFKPPFGSFQLAYQRGTSPQGEESDQGNTLFSKLTWVF